MVRLEGKGRITDGADTLNVTGWVTRVSMSLATRVNECELLPLYTRNAGITSVKSTIAMVQADEPHRPDTFKPYFISSARCAGVALVRSSSAGQPWASRYSDWVVSVTSLNPAMAAICILGLFANTSPSIMLMVSPEVKLSAVIDGSSALKSSSPRVIVTSPPSSVVSSKVITSTASPTSPPLTSKVMR